jgi:hypothetical protein
VHLCPLPTDPKECGAPAHAAEKGGVTRPHRPGHFSEPFGGGTATRGARVARTALPHHLTHLMHPRSHHEPVVRLALMDNSRSGYGRKRKQSGRQLDLEDVPSPPRSSPVRSHKRHKAVSSSSYASEQILSLPIPFNPLLNPFSLAPAFVPPSPGAASLPAAALPASSASTAPPPVAKPKTKKKLIRLVDGSTVEDGPGLGGHFLADSQQLGLHSSLNLRNAVPGNFPRVGGPSLSSARKVSAADLASIAASANDIAALASSMLAPAPPALPVTLAPYPATSRHSAVHALLSALLEPDATATLTLPSAPLLASLDRFKEHSALAVPMSQTHQNLPPTGKEWGKAIAAALAACPYLAGAQREACMFHRENRSPLLEKTIRGPLAASGQPTYTRVDRKVQGFRLRTELRADLLSPSDSLTLLPDADVSLLRRMFPFFCTCSVPDCAQVHVPFATFNALRSASEEQQIVMAPAVPSIVDLSSPSPDLPLVARALSLVSKAAAISSSSSTLFASDISPQSQLGWQIINDGAHMLMLREREKAVRNAAPGVPGPGGKAPK